MRYCMFFRSKGLQKYQRPKLEVFNKEFANSARFESAAPRVRLNWQIFFSRSPTLALMFLQPLNLQERTVPHLKDLSLVWRLKTKAMAWLLKWFMFAQNTPISYQHIIQRPLLTQKLAALQCTVNVSRMQSGQFSYNYEWMAIKKMNV